MNVPVLSETLWSEGSGGELATYLYANLLARNHVNVKVAMTLSSNSLNKLWDNLPVYNIRNNRLR